MECFRVAILIIAAILLSFILRDDVEIRVKGRAEERYVNNKVKRMMARR